MIAKSELVDIDGISIGDIVKELYCSECGDFIIAIRVSNAQQFVGVKGGCEGRVEKYRCLSCLNIVEVDPDK